MSDAQFAQLQRVLTDSRALTDVSEAHGTLAGALCAASDYALEDWLAEIYAEGQADEATAHALREVYEATRLALASDQMRFTALLPADDEPIAARAAALGQWCQGFLYGLGTSAIRDADDLPQDIGEIVRDLSAITQVGVDAAESEDTNESAYTELVKFVRVAVQLLFDHLAPYRVAAESASGSPALH
jgi:yecA family protein